MTVSVKAKPVLLGILAAVIITVFLLIYGLAVITAVFTFPCFVDDFAAVKYECDTLEKPPPAG